MDIYFERIKPLFDQSGKSDAELEREIGIPPKKISQWNIRYTKSYTKYISQIASYFHVSSDYLLGNTDDPRLPEEISAEKEKSPTLQAESEVDRDNIKKWLENRTLAELSEIMADVADAVRRKMENETES